MEFKTLLSPEDVKRLDRVSARFPGLVVRQWAGVANHIANRLKRTLQAGGGINGVPAWAPRHAITLRLGKPTWGGMISKSIAKWGNPFTGGQYWGFPAGIREYFGEDLQTAEARDFTRREKSYLRRRLKMRDPGTYNRPERPLIAPFAAGIPVTIRKEFVPRVMRALEKELRQ